MTISRRFAAIALLFIVSTTARASFVIGEEKPIAKPGFGAVPGRQRPAAMATDGSSFLVLWGDESGSRGLYASLERGRNRFGSAPDPHRRVRAKRFGRLDRRGLSRGVDR